MLALSAPGAHRKPLTAPLALAPLGGLLATCVFFLFVTARFDDIAALPSVPTWPEKRSDGARDLRIRLNAQGFTLRFVGEEPMRIARLGPSLDLGTLCTNARRALEQHADIRLVRLQPEDGVSFTEVIASYDTLLAEQCAP